MAKIIRSITPTTCLVGLALTAAAIGGSAVVEGGEAGISIAQSQQKPAERQVFAGYREGSLRVRSPGNRGDDRATRCQRHHDLRRQGPRQHHGVRQHDQRRACVQGEHRWHLYGEPAEMHRRSGLQDPGAGNLRSLHGAPFRRGHRQPWRGDQVPDHYTRSGLRRQQRPAVGDDESRSSRLPAQPVPDPRDRLRDDAGSPSWSRRPGTIAPGARSPAEAKNDAHLMVLLPPFPVGS